MKDNIEIFDLSSPQSETVMEPPIENGSEIQPMMGNEKKKKSPAVTLILVFVLIAGLAGVGYFLWTNYQDKFMDIIKRTIKLELKDITVELGQPLPDSSVSSNYFVKTIDSSEYKFDFTAIPLIENNTSEAGEFNYVVNYKEKDFIGKIIVQDTIKPVVETKKLYIAINGKLEAKDFILSCTDLSNVCNATFQSDAINEEFKTLGTHKVYIIISDASENKNTIEVEFEVLDETFSSVTKYGDLNVSYFSEELINWNNIYAYSFSTALPDSSERYKTKKAMVEEYDWETLIRKRNENPTDIVINYITAYNQYDFILGTIVKATFKLNDVEQTTYLSFDDEV